MQHVAPYCKKSYGEQVVKYFLFGTPEKKLSKI